MLPERPSIPEGIFGLYIVMGMGVVRLPDATYVITTGDYSPPMQWIGLGYTEGT